MKQSILLLNVKHAVQKVRWKVISFVKLIAMQEAPNILGQGLP